MVSTLVSLLLTFVQVLNCYGFSFSDILLPNNNLVPENSYFSYSLLLQTGRNGASIVVSAPKNRINLDQSGTIYRCFLDGIKKSKCEQFPTEKYLNTTINGNLFGISLDGSNHVYGSLIVCAPRIHIPKYSSYLEGLCLYKQNGFQNDDKFVPITLFRNNFRTTACCEDTNRLYYDYGFALAGFDVSLFPGSSNQDLFLEKIFLGAPGVKKDSGEAISYSVFNRSIIGKVNENHPIPTEEESYYGYSVATEVLMSSPSFVLHLAGAPRANNLHGRAILYYSIDSDERRRILANLQDEEIGSYFGAEVLIIDITNNNEADLLIGAPMSSGKTWDEGSAYFYKCSSGFTYPNKVKLTGSRKIGSRFGSVISNLGDYDLDGFNDVAIAAPYEDNGIGAVYIYRGSRNGLNDKYHQRLSPLEFNIPNLNNVKGFGLGLSKGNDIDSNGHNDIVIGAYRTSQIFVFKSDTIIDYQFTINSTISSFIDGVNDFWITMCISCSKRSRKKSLSNLSQIEFEIFQLMDYRATNESFYNTINVPINGNACTNHHIGVKQTFKDISPFQIEFKIETNTKHIIAEGPKSLDLKIPYSHGCGNDSICTTGLSIELLTNKSKLILGLDREIDLKVIVRNELEPAYQCELRIEVSSGLELRNRKNCIKYQHGNYTCLVSDKLIGTETLDFVFDMKDVMQPEISFVNMLVAVTSTGINDINFNDVDSLDIPVEFENTPYIGTKLIPESIEINRNSKPLNNIEAIFQFSISKSGPSPLKIDLNLLLPTIKYQNQNIIKILDVQSTIDNVETSCLQIQENHIDNDFLIDSNNNKIPLNKTIMISSSFEGFNSIHYSCQEDYLYKSSQFGIFKIKTLIQTKLLVKKFEKELRTKDVISITAIAYLNNTNTKLSTSSTFFIFIPNLFYIPLWAYLLAAIFSVLILLLISLALYKCHFFDRNYKTKLQEEKILQNNEFDIGDDFFDNVIMRSKETNNSQISE